MAKWLDKYNDGGPVQENYNDASASMGPGFVGLGYDTTGRNYSPAWGGQFAMGGSIPGAVGFTYARTQNPAPSNGPYAKKTKASAQNGKEMKFYQEGLDWKPKNISKNGSVIKDDMGQWAHPGEITEIGSNEITMQGVDYPVLGISDTGDTQMMYPDQDYKFDGKKVTEYPMAQDGENISKKLKKEAEERIERMKQPKATVSQYTPKKGEQAKFDKQKLERIAEENAVLNRFARSKAAGNLEDAIMFAADVMGGVEGTSAIKGMLKKAPKFKLSKAATTVTEDKVNKSTKDAVASTIVNNTTGRTQYFDNDGNELFSISKRRSIPNPDYIDVGNSYLKNNDPFDRTKVSTLKDIPISGGRTTKVPGKKENGGWLNKYK